MLPLQGTKRLRIVGFGRTLQSFAGIYRNSQRELQVVVCPLRFASLSATLVSVQVPLVPLARKEKAHKLTRNLRDTGRVSLEHPAGQTVVYRPVSQAFPVVCYRKTDILPEHRLGVPGTPGPSREFSEFYMIFAKVGTGLMGSAGKGSTGF